MKPYVKLAEAKLPNGTLFSLHKHDGNFYLKNDRLDLMSTALTYSEQMLAEKGCAKIIVGHGKRPEHPKVLIGGLGMGFTLKRALEIIGKPATVEVAELVDEIVAWNRTFLVEHNGPLLEDERTTIYQGDLFDCLAQDGRQGYYDVILMIRQAIAPGGCVAYWLAEPTPSFETSLIKAGFRVEATPAKPHEKSKRPRHCIYVARPK